MAAALGVSLGMDRHPAVCLVGDGSALFAPQALWSAARLDLPVVFVVFNNGRYEILRHFLRAMGGDAQRTGRYVGIDIQNPAVDFVGLAESLGVPASKATNAHEVPEAVRAALEAQAPRLVEVVVAPEE
jgi:benzoylformate decarboxylase